MTNNRTIIFPFLLIFLLSGPFGAMAQGTRKTTKPLPAAGTIKVKVLVVIQDPVVPGEGNKRLHEVFKTPGYSFSWHNPEELMKAYRDTLNSVSHGAVKYEIVKVINDDLFFTKIRGTDSLLRKEQVISLLREPQWQTFRSKGTSFDYNAFIQHYGLCEMRDKGEINEVWVWSFPYCGMWESTFAGKGAFWLNSEPVEGTTCKDLLTVMGLNYEREMSLALESYGHRVESVMKQVYGRWDNKAAGKNNWELFTTIESHNPGGGHIGNIHFPVNGESDYDYKNKKVVNTFADVWKYYPGMSAEAGRQVDCAEWQCSHLGYMCWWYRHLPHFAGLNKLDGHLNNWWHYVVDYNAAVRLENQLKTSHVKRK
ncbi:hypothetical protein [Arcticibacter tournemirensis]